MASTSPAQVLVRGERVVMAGRQGQPAPPVPAMVSLPATVPDQAEVLDLSSGPRRDPPPPSLPPPRPVPPPYVTHALPTSSLAQNPAPAHSRPRHEDSALTLVGALRRLGTRVNLVPVNFSVDRTRSHSPVRSHSPGLARETMVTVARASSEDRRGARSSNWQIRAQRDRSHRDRSSSRSHGERSSSSRSHDRAAGRSHGERSSGSRSHGERTSSRSHRERQAVIERMTEFQRSSRPPSPSLPRQSELGLTYVSRLSPSVALPLAEATRLLGGHTINNSWEADSVREADMFVRDLASTSTSRGSATTLDRNDIFANVIERPHTATNDNVGMIQSVGEVPSTTSEQVLPVRDIPSDQTIPSSNVPNDQAIPATQISQDQAIPITHI